MEPAFTQLFPTIETSRAVLPIHQCDDRAERRRPQEGPERRGGRRNLAC
jgi:hypothetical protein